MLLLNRCHGPVARCYGYLSAKYTVDALLSRHSALGNERLVTELKEECRTPAGLASVLDARERCNTQIKKLPQQQVLQLDKTLFAVLKDVVCSESTIVTKATMDCPREIVEIVRTSDRVHPITTERELENRLAQNRSVFILTHQLLPSRPLVVLHVAHSSGMFQCVSDIKEGLDRSSTDSLCRLGERGDEEGLVGDRGGVLSEMSNVEGFDGVHTFYSISSLEIALRGVDAAAEVTTYLSSSTSPIPPPPHLVEPVSQLAAYYLVREKQRGNVLDPVGHFHLTNGAAMWALRWAGTRSVEMQRQSLGLMVNYLYENGETEARAAQYASDERGVTVGAAHCDVTTHENASGPTPQASQGPSRTSNRTVGRGTGRCTRLVPQTPF
eukprot:sb/3465637/